MATNTKIIATIGPACDNKETLQQMVDAGVGTFRVNMSHGDSSAKKRLFDLVKSIELSDGNCPAIIADLCGPKIRVTRVPEGFSINDGDTLSISNDEGSGDITVTSGISFSNLKLETNILINDGRIQLSVSNISSANLIECKVLVGGEIELGKGVNFPGVTLDVPAMAGTSRVTPGKLTPLPNSISPPTRTLHSIKLAELMLLTLNCILPSLIKIFVSSFKLEKEIPLVTVISPEPSSFEMLKVSPSFMLKPSGTRVTLILGPHRSAIIAGQLPSLNSIDFTKSKSLFLALESPCDMLTRKVPTPASTICCNVSLLSQAGPIVAIILVLVAILIIN